MKNGIPINPDNEEDELSKFYTIQNTELAADPAKNDFKSVVSTLKWNMALLSGGQLNRFNDNANYTCFSTRNHYGSGVSSTTEFRIECKLRLVVRFFVIVLYMYASGDLFCRST